MRVGRTAGGAAGKIAIAGSDSHTIAGVGHTYTKVPGARTVDEFFRRAADRPRSHTRRPRELRQAHADVFSIVRSLFWDKPWTLALSPLALLVPAFYRGALVERNSFLPEVVLGYRAW